MVKKSNRIQAKILIFIFINILNCCFSSIFAQTYSISGNAYLKNQINNDNIKVLFSRMAPSPFKDSILTNTSGNYLIQIPSGIYDITFSKEGYISQSLQDISIYSTKSLSDITLELIGLHGNLSGILSQGVYDINSDIQVVKGDTLIINPGVKLLFGQNISFKINGVLIANGTINDSIIFSGSDAAIKWNGIKFNDGSGGSSISYAIIESSQQTGITCNNASPYLNNLVIRNSTGTQGGAINLTGNSILNIYYLKCYNNSSLYGGGIIINNGSMLRLNCSLLNNNTANDGSAIFNFEKGTCILNFVDIYNNTGLDAIFFPTKISNSIVAGNDGYGVYYCDSIKYCDFWNNTRGSFSNCNSYIGVNVTTNSGGYSCDAFSNIQEDPSFNSPNVYDLTLKPNSPCINAGNPDYPNDSDNSRVDMGICSSMHSKDPQSINFGPLIQRTYGDLPFNLTASANSGLPITYQSSNTEVATVSGNTVNIIGAGITNIKATQSGNKFYGAADNKSQTLTINKANQTITFNPVQGKTLGDAPFILSAGSTSGLPIVYSSSNTKVATIAGSTVTIIGAGSAEITANQLGNSNYNAANPVSSILNVEKMTQIITFESIPSKTFGDLSFDLNASSSSGLPITYLSSNNAVAAISGNKVTIIGSGSAEITASQEGSEVYKAASAVQLLMVDKAIQNITFEPISAKTYGDNSFELIASSSSGLEIVFSSSNTNIATISGNKLTVVGAGSVDITATQGGNDNYYAASSKIQSLTINKASQSIKFDPISSKTHGDLAFNLNASSSSGLPITYISSNTNVATITGNTVTIVGVGISDITASQAGSDNYNSADPVMQVLTVNQATGISELSDKKLNIYPNPSSGRFMIEFEDDYSGEVIIKINSIIGNQLKTYRNFKSAHYVNFNIDAGILPKGIYFMEICTPKYTISKIVTIE